MRLSSTVLAIILGFSDPYFAWSIEPIKVQATSGESKEAILGSLLFNDTTLSNPPGQSCATCHIPSEAFAENKIVSIGATGKKGTRNAPTLMYNKYTPPFSYDGDRRYTWVGGQFWDGRADTLAEQALGPLLNPDEMNNTRTSLAKGLRQLGYFSLFLENYGDKILKNDDELIASAARALQVFQMTALFAPFTSKFDYAEKGMVQLSEQEKLGRKVFQKYMCTDCHAGLNEEKEIFTNFTHNNILVPLNPAIPETFSHPDKGVANNSKVSIGQRKDAAGRFKTPTMRNIAITAPYMHNGVFTTLREVIDFYNDMEDRKRWGPAPFAENRSGLLNTQPGLSESEIQALIAFLNTLTDGYEVPQKN